MLFCLICCLLFLLYLCYVFARLGPPRPAPAPAMPAAGSAPGELRGKLGKLDTDTSSWQKKARVCAPKLDTDTASWQQKGPCLCTEVAH